MNLYYKVHHNFRPYNKTTFRDTNTNSINQLLSAEGIQLESETVIVRTEDEYYDLDLNKIDARFVNKRGLRRPPAGWLPGEIGIWVSNILALQSFLRVSTSESDICLILESDTWLAPEEGIFIQSMNVWIQSLPEGWDYLNLYVAENLRHHYDPDIHDVSNEMLCKNYTEIYFPALIWSTKGAAKLLDIARSEIHTPIDRQVFEDTSFMGYAIKPDCHQHVSLWTAEALNNSTIQDSELRIVFPD